MIARGYAQIQAAGALSRQISASNDVLLASMQSQRQVQQQRDAARRSAARQDSGGSGSAFDQYIRGTETVKDPYWGTSEQSSSQSYHWTDGQGNYRNSNDASFNPNIGGGGANWQLMQRAR